MNKLFTKIASLALGAAMAFGVGVAASSKNVSAAHGAENDISLSENAAGASYTSTLFDISSGGATNSNYYKLGSASFTSKSSYNIDGAKSISYSITTRKFGGPSAAQAVVNLSLVNGNTTVATASYSPSDTTLRVNSGTFSVTGDTSSVKFVIQGNGTSGGGKGVGISQITFTATSGGSSCEHTWDSGTVKTAATCTTAGVMEYTCTKCSETKEEAIAALGHNYIAGTPVAATCTEGGYTPYTCSRCSDSYHGDETAALGHNFVDHVCTRCGADEPNEVTVTLSTFADVSGYVEDDENISFAATQGTAGTAPAVYSGVLRIYQNGGLLTITANNGAKIKSITIGSAQGTTVQTSIDSGTYSSNHSISANGTYTEGSLNSDVVVFKCTGTSSSTRLYLNYLSVIYEPADVETYRVSFNGNTASGSMADVTDVVGDYTLPANGFTVPSGKVFAGWKANNTGNLLSVGSTYDVQADVEFYAQWSDVYTVSFDGNTASGSMADVTDVAGNYTLPANGYTVPSGKEFLGWKANNSGDTLAAGSNYVVSANVTFYAQWGNVWNVTFTAGTNGSGNQVVSVSEGTYALPAFSTLTSISANTGYQFQDYTIGGTNYDAGVEVTISAATSVTVNFESKPLETTYDFIQTWGWGTSYGEHTINGKTEASGDYEATIYIARADIQSSGVGSDRPYICGNTNADAKMITFTLTETGYKIQDVTVTFQQRGSNAPSVKLFKGDTNTGTALDSGTIGTKNTLSTSNLNDTIFTVTLNAGGTSNKGVALTSIDITLAPLSSFGTLDHIKITGTPNVVYHVGETFSFTGFAVTAYDGSDESTANFKDVTSSVETDLDDPTPFVDGDVPGIDCDVQYTGDGGTDTTSFHVYVYALAEYKLVTSEPTDWSGQYLIVGVKNDTSLAMNGGLTALDVEGNHKTVSPDANDVIEAGQELEWTIAAVSGGYSIEGKSGKYIGWSSGSSNGLTASDTALVNTLTFSSNNVTISGSGGRNLTLNTDGTGRFRYYTSGTVKLYKLVESDNADAYAQLFLGAFTCDDSGTNKPTFGWKVAEVTRWTWALLATEYDTLTSVEKEQFRLGVASESGTNIEKAIARYDYIVGKYFKTGLDTSFTDFMSRNPSPVGSGSVVLKTIAENVNSTAIIIVTSMIGLSAVGGYFFLRKRKEI